jgi:prepilin-type N-terminal cleavage/methylation domain-containing protein/prepilin-type processing-associated H-X9-DG protein
MSILFTVQAATCPASAQTLRSAGWKTRATTLSRPNGFTLLELLTVVAIISILAGLLLPGISKIKDKVQGMSCLNNLKQLQITFLLYAYDHNERVVLNVPSLKQSWVYSELYGPDLPYYNPEASTNTQWLIDPEYAAFADYIKAPSIYKCPGDKSTVTIADGTFRRVRSYGATFYHRNLNDFNSSYRLPDKVKQTPAMVMLFADVHPGWLIDQSYLGCRDPEVFDGFPAYWHQGAGVFTFADGHVEPHRWRDDRTIRPLNETIRYDSSATSRRIASPKNPDARWIWERSPGTGYLQAISSY